MTTLDTSAVRGALLTENDRLAEFYLSTDPATPIPACPGWSLANLVAHVGGGHRWAAAMVTDRATERLDFAEVPGIRRPHEVQEAAEWLREGARAVIEAVDATGPDAPVWTPFGGPRPAEWWVRRRLHEVTGHRADALLALDRTVDLEGALGADGLSELLSIIEGASAQPDLARFTHPLDEGTLALHSTDGHGGWFVHRAGDGIAWTTEQHAASVTVAGTATDLYLLLLRRIPADHPALTVSGDPKVLTTWLERTAF
ncbi:maleylpyruvate isomerase family mycothiol-dependent enzyme [Nocardia sp. NEAU-G5]|uniref:Maleylpyruvate isomerase family mycothiol-dependent enzyme n=1 Tax=Nocardia albiluteola TaxID=2842303 RepID=A0ABS6AXR2_9NOCA|nr:maleylpyruvate isomerase family mycothiol-dependent enzyme [Nocardia albiluteola]MBU3062838.1 maleylpyruvate isomerase family mycothiol-dependent enzyme [Nocardia albiluteola]